jgi:hypothetical protein
MALDPPTGPNYGEFMAARGRVRIGRVIAIGLAAALAVACLMVVATKAASGSPVSAARSCGHFHAQGLRFRATIVRGRVTCKGARKVLRAFMSGRGKKHGSGPEANLTWTVFGWTCGHGTGGGGCIRHGNDASTARDYIVAQQG